MRILRDDAPWDHPLKKALNKFKHNFAKVEAEPGFTLYHPSAHDYASNYIKWYLNQHFEYPSNTPQIEDSPIDLAHKRALAAYYILYLNDKGAGFNPYQSIISLLNTVASQSSDLRRILKYFHVKILPEEYYSSETTDTESLDRPACITMLDKALMALCMKLEQGHSEHTPYALGLFFEQMAYEAGSKGKTFLKQASQLNQAAKYYYELALTEGHPPLPSTSNASITIPI